MSLLATGGRTVPPEWIDYIGHMMDAYYFVAFTEATEAFLDHLGLGERYRADSGCGMYTAESHLCFSRSVRAGTVLRYDSQLLGCDRKRLHVFHRMSQSPGGDVVATNELMFLHVDIASERVTPMPPERWQAASRLAAAHAALTIPASAGRRVQLRRPRALCKTGRGCRPSGPARAAGAGGTASNHNGSCITRTFDKTP